MFSVRSDEDLGVGEFLDLKLLVDWAVNSGFILFSSFLSMILQFMGCGGILIHTGITNIHYQRFMCVMLILLEVQKDDHI
jgi:hypothetical protein